MAKTNKDRNKSKYGKRTSDPKQSSERGAYSTRVSRPSSRAPKPATQAERQDEAQTEGDE